MDTTLYREPTLTPRARELLEIATQIETAAVDVERLIGSREAARLCLYALEIRRLVDRG